MIIKKNNFKNKKKILFLFYVRLNTALKYFLKNGDKIGSICEIFPNIELGSEPYLIEIGNNVRITNGVKFVTYDCGMWTLRKTDMLKNADLFAKIKIGDNCYIGYNTIIMPSMTIGENCIIGCGAVLTKDIPAN